MRKGKLQFDKWMFKLGLVPIYWRNNGMMLHFGFFKIVSRPAEGMVFTKGNYKGFWFRKEFEFTGFEINF